MWQVPVSTSSSAEPPRWAGSLCSLLAAPPGPRSAEAAPKQGRLLLTQPPPSSCEKLLRVHDSCWGPGLGSSNHVTTPWPLGAMSSGQPDSHPLSTLQQGDVQLLVDTEAQEALRDPSVIQSGPGLGPGHTGNKAQPHRTCIPLGRCNHAGDRACPRRKDLQNGRVGWGGRSQALTGWRGGERSGTWKEVGKEPVLGFQAVLEQWEAGVSAGHHGGEAWGDRATHRRLCALMENTVLSTLNEPTAKDYDLTHVLARAPCCLENELQARQGQVLRAPLAGPVVPCGGVVA